MLTEEGVSVEGPLMVEQNWETARMITWVLHISSCYKLVGAQTPYWNSSFISGHKYEVVQGSKLKVQCLIHSVIVCILNKHCVFSHIPPSLFCNLPLPFVLNAILLRSQFHSPLSGFSSYRIQLNVVGVTHILKTSRFVSSPSEFLKVVFVHFLICSYETTEWSLMIS